MLPNLFELLAVRRVAADALQASNEWGVSDKPNAIQRLDIIVIILWINLNFGAANESLVMTLFFCAEFKRGIIYNFGAKVPRRAFAYRKKEPKSSPFTPTFINIE